MPRWSTADPMAFPLPGFCGLPCDEWPWREPLPGAQWMALRFDRRQLAQEDIARCAIDIPAPIRRAAPKRQAEFLAGRYCAREALHRLTGLAHVPAVAESKAPLWPEGMIGSITHSGDFAAVLVAPTRLYRGIGLDAEALIDTARAERLAGQILTPAERDWLATLPAERRGRFVTLAFSLKESLFKALFPLVGVRFYFQDAELTAWNAETQQATLQLLTPLAPDWPAASRLHGQYVLLDGYLVSSVSIPA